MRFRQNVAMGTTLVFVVAWSAAAYGQAPGDPGPGEKSRPRGQSSGDRDAKPQPGGRGGPTFEGITQRFDKNHDDKVTRAEWQGPEQFFGRMDQNGDRVITKKEFEATMRSRARFGGSGGRRDASQSPDTPVEIKGQSVVEGQKAGIEVGQYAPDFELQPVQPYPSLRRWLGDDAPQNIEHGVKLSQLVGKAPIMLFFGSFT